MSALMTPIVALLLWSSFVLMQATPVPSTHLPVQFVTQTRAQKKHATIVNNELTLTGGAKEPYLSSAAVMDFEIVGEIRLSDDADAHLLLYAWEAAILSPPVFPLGLGNSATFGELSGAGVHATDDATVAAAFRRGAQNWQWIRISCVGRHVRVTVPAGVLTEGDLPSPEYGRIGIEVTKGSVSLRNWQFVREEAPAVRPLLEDNPDAVDADKDVHPGLMEPKLRHEVKPQYTANAMRGKVQGNTEMEAIVEPDGLVGPIRITKSLDRELDIQAIRAVRQWGFAPGLMGGKPVRCRVTIIMAFTLK